MYTLSWTKIVSRKTVVPMAKYRVAAFISIEAIFRPNTSEASLLVSNLYVVLLLLLSN